MTGFHGHRASIGIGMVNQLIHVLAEDIVNGGVAEHSDAGEIREGAVAKEIDAIDPLRRGDFTL
jgi:hypothetical protein